jgi:hypothetical protein
MLISNCQNNVLMGLRIAGKIREIPRSNAGGIEILPPPLVRGTSNGPETKQNTV